MDSKILLQDPADERSPNVLESLLEACDGATDGGAVFAYASRAGISMLFKDKQFAKFLRRGTFDLVVGLDSITNEASINQLRDEEKRYPKLVVRAFLHNRKVTFHPKFAWFRTPIGGASIVGSGNLTPGGLAGNWEAFTRVELGLNGAASVAEEWKRWKYRHANELRKTTDPEALARAKKNKYNVIDVPEAVEDPLVAPLPPTNFEDVLVAELPKGGPRWGQANFDYDTFTGFFDLHPAETRRVLLWHVNSQGIPGPIEIRPSVSVKSRNYRFELDAAHGLAYPDNGRPIVMFRGTGPRRFRYQLLMPDTPGFSQASQILQNRWKGPSRKMRRITISSADLKREWPNSPLL